MKNHHQIHRGEITTAKDIIYPEKKGNNKLWHMKNLKNLREQEEKNRLLKEEKEKYVPPEPYKLKQFQNVKSKLYDKTKDWIMNEQQYLKNKPKPKSQMQKEKPPRGRLLPIQNKNIYNNQNAINNSNLSPPELSENIDLINQNDNKSMFEKYYEQKLRKSRSKSPENIQNILQNNNNNAYEENIYNSNRLNKYNIQSNIANNQQENINNIQRNNNGYEENIYNNNNNIPPNNNYAPQSNNFNPPSNYAPPSNNNYAPPSNNNYAPISNNNYAPISNNNYAPPSNNDNINNIMAGNSSINKENESKMSPKVEELLKSLPPEAANLTDEELDLLLQKYNEDLKKQISEKEKEINNLDNEINKYSNKKEKEHVKGPTPKVNEAPLILPKIQRNYLLENRKLITDHKIQQKKIKENKDDNLIHKDYGKTPEYLEKYKKEAEIKKEMIKKMREEAKYPKGTKLLSEEERLSTLNGLKNTQKELNNLLEKMPITTRTMAIQNRKKELEDKLNEVEKAIEMFSKKQVFVKVQ